MQELRLIGDGVLITPLADGEAPVLAGLGNDREIARMMYTLPHPFGEADARARIRTSPWRGRPGFRAAIRKPDESLMGEIGFGSAGAGAPLSIAYWLGRAHWGQGVASRALGCFLPFAFRLSGAEFLEATAYRDNPVSVHLLRKFGFQPYREGVDETHLVRRAAAEYVDYRLTRADWEAARA